MNTFDEFYEKMNKKVYFLIIKYGVTGDDLEDLCQEVFLKALEHWEDVKGHPNLEGWIRTTIRNVYSKYVRHNIQNMHSDYNESLEIAYIEDGYDEVVMEDLLGSIYGAKDKSFIEAFAIEGYTIQELSQKQNKSNGSIRTRLYRARKKLQEYIESEL